MIRGSVIVAIVAILVSLIVHIFGLSVTAPNLTQPQAEEKTTDTVTLGNTFEELAEASPDPVEPEPAEVPEPPVETPPEPESAEVPTSQAQVASPDPQRVTSPDTGTGPITQSEVIEPEVTEPVGQTDSDEGASDDVTSTPPVAPETTAEAPLENPDANVAPVETTTAEIPVAPESEQLAALPAPEATPVPVIPLERDSVDPDIPDVQTEPAPEEPEIATPESEDSDSEQAVTASIRPQLPNRQPPTEPRATLDGFSNFDNLLYPEQIVESPLSVYRREGIDAFTISDPGTRSGGRGSGNSDTTNYAGQVLVHLNRAPLVHVKTRGFAQVFFEINPDGSLAWVDIIRSSGSSDVERAAKEQVRGAAPFPLPPGGVSRKLSFYYQNSRL